MRKVGLVLLVLVTIGSLTYAQQDYDYNIMGTGARARGMGGAFIGVADDATAVGWNPAGIAQLDKMEASVVGAFTMVKYTGEMTFDTQTESYDETASHIAPAFASLVLPYKMGNRNISFAVAYQRMIDMGAKTKGSDEDYTYGTYNWTYEAKGGMDAITPALAIQLNDNFSVGLAGNIYINGLTQDYNETYIDIGNCTDNYKYEEDYSGFNMSLGALVNMKTFSLGFMARLPFNLGVDITETNTWDYTANGGNSGTDVDKMTGAEFSMPMMIGFGGALKPSDKLTLAVDYEIRSYSNSEFSYEGITDEAGLNDCNQLRVGMEYIFSGPNAVFPVRLGFRTDPKTFNGFTGTWTDPDTSQASGTVITGGFGLIMGKVMFDLAYEYGNLIPTDVSGDYYGYQASLTKTYKTHNIMASAIIHF